MILSHRPFLLNLVPAPGFIAPALLTLALLLTCGCNQSPPQQPATQPAATPATASSPAEPSAASAAAVPLPAGWDQWTRDEALSRLSQEDSAVSAALRLVRLAEVVTTLAPAELTATHLKSLRVMRVTERQFVFGFATDVDRLLRAALLIGADGAVTRLVEGDDEPFARFYVSQDAEVFPHLVVQPDRVTIWGEVRRVALVLKSGSGLRFDVHMHNEYPFVGLFTGLADSPTEATRYRWDPYELAFIGPQTDKLPPPAEGVFELDLSESQALVPEGGAIEPPKPIENKPPPQKQPTEPEPM